MVSGRYFCFDIPAAVYDKLEQRFHDVSDDFVLDFNLMYTFYCFPNIFLPLFGGHLIDRFGQKTMMLVFTSCIFVGQFFVSFGCMSRSFHFILFGRFIFGLGESLNISIITILSSYFVQGELAFAVILLFLSSRFCNFLNLLVTPVVELEHGVTAAFWVGTLTSVIGVISAFILAEFDHALKFPYSNGSRSYNSTLDIGKGTHRTHQTPLLQFGHNGMKTKSSVSSSLPVVMEDDDDDDDLNEVEMGGTADSIIAELNNKQKNYGTCGNHYDSINQSIETKKYDAMETPHEDHSHGSESNKFARRTLIALFFLCFFLYGAILPFLDMANPIIHIGYFHHHTHHMTDHEIELWVTRLQAIPIVILAVFAPCVAVTVDYCGHRPSLFVLASILLFFGHCVVLFRLGNLMFLVLALVLLGLAHAVTVAVTWTCIQYLVTPSQQGLATGILLCVFHLSQSVFPIIVSYMITSKVRFIDSHVFKHKLVALEIIDIKKCEALFIGISFLALFFSLIIFIFDESGHAELRLSGITPPHDYQLVEEIDSTDDYIYKDDEISNGDHVGNYQSSDKVEHPSTSNSNIDTFTDNSNRNYSGVRPRSKSMSDTAPLTSCMRKYYSKQRKSRKPSRPPKTIIGDEEYHMDYDSDDNNSNHSDDLHDDDSKPSTNRRRTVSFAGDCDFTPQRRAGQGQHPPIVPLSIKMPPPPTQSNSVSPSGTHRKMIFAHF